VKDRLTTLGLAAGALVLFYVFFVPKPAAEPPDAALPLSTEAGHDGYQAAWRWLKRQGVPVAALHEPYTRLSSLTESAPRGNLLLTTLPHRVPARNDELNALDAWVSRGNTLLVMAALDDQPRWAIAASAGLLRTVRRMTRLNFEVDEDRPAAAAAGAAAQGDAAPGRAKSRTQRALNAVQALLDPQPLIITPRGAHPLFTGVQSILAVSEFPASRWHATPMDARVVLEIGERPVTGAQGATVAPAIWLERQGDGQVLVFAVATPFSSGVIAEKDNARLLSNIIAWSRGPGGSVIFDDDHQGAASYYDAKAFFRDPRLHRTLLWILVLWLLFVLGSQRMRPAADAWNRADITSFIAVTGGFFASSLTPAAAGAQLFHNFFNLVRRSLHLPEDGLPVWEWLGADARVRRPQLGELRRLYERTHAGKSVDLVQLHNLLTGLRGTLE
jgi:hypothetical protein